ncbi:MAG: amidohydrolase family protein, partial [Gemmatimonadetes bacterium]|nr:amidohydrolase family protein [Gemmatimonadota bacterium]
VGLGSDSVASVDSPDLFAEARAARALADLGPAAAIGLLTLGPARALGLEGQIGSLEPRKWADLCLVRVSDLPPDPGSAASCILDCGAGNVLATWVGGRLVYGTWPGIEGGKGR